MNHTDAQVAETAAPHPLLAEMSILAAEQAVKARASSPERALDWVNRALSYHPIFPEDGPANRSELLEIKMGLLDRMGREVDAQEIRLELLEDARLKHRLTIAVMAAEYKTYRNAYCDSAADVGVWTRVLLDDAERAIITGDRARAVRDAVELGEFSAQKWHPDPDGRLEGLVTSLAGPPTAHDLPLAYRSLDWLTRELFPAVVISIGDHRSGRTLRCLTPVIDMADNRSESDSTATLWSKGEFHPIIEQVRTHLHKIHTPSPNWYNGSNWAEARQLACDLVDHLGLGLGTELADRPDARFVLDCRLAGSSLAWMRMWSAIRAELREQNSDAFEAPWEHGWRTVSAEIFNIFVAVAESVLVIPASETGMSAQQAMRTLFRRCSLLPPPPWKEAMKFEAL